MNQYVMGEAALEFIKTAPILNNKKACWRGVVGR